MKGSIYEVVNLYVSFLYCKPMQQKELNINEMQVVQYSKPFQGKMPHHCPMLITKVQSCRHKKEKIEQTYRFYTKRQGGNSFVGSNRPTRGNAGAQATGGNLTPSAIDFIGFFVEFS